MTTTRSIFFILALLAAVAAVGNARVDEILSNEASFDSPTQDMDDIAPEDTLLVDVITPEDTQDAMSTTLAQKAPNCNVFGALTKETKVPLNLYKIADETLAAAKVVIAASLKGALKCKKKRWYRRKICAKTQKKVLTGIANLKSKELVDQLVVALQPHAVAFFQAEEGKEIAVLAKTFGEAKAMPEAEAETFVAHQLSTELGQLLSTLQEPMMKLIPTILLNFIPGWLLVPSSVRRLIIEQIHSNAKTTKAHAKLTEKFQELMHKAATHIIKVTAIGELVTQVIMDTPAICAFGLAQKFAMAATAKKC